MQLNYLHMKIYTYLAIVMITSLTFAQTPEEKKKITSQYDVSKLNELKESFIISDEITNERIETYIAQHNIEKRIALSNGTVMQIVDIIDGKPLYVSTDNANAAKSTKTQFLHNGGGLGLNLEGQNMTIGVWDGGAVLVTHQEFQNATNTGSRAIIGDGTIATSDHGTHVGGTMVAKGANASAKGMAPKANLISFNWDNDETEVVTQITNNALLLSNHSYGVPVLDDMGNPNAPTWMMGCYNTDARNWDIIAYNAPYYLQVASAGNSGTSEYSGGTADGYDKLTTDKNAKNNLIVANANPFVLPNGFVNLIANSSSSQGPSDDGRVKPDIAADGTNLFSSIGTSNTAYATFSGTSMASPNTSGTLLLLQQYYNDLHSSYMRASTLKALVCHTAGDDFSKPGPDPVFGWGILDAKVSAETMLKATTGEALITEQNLANGSTYTITFSASGTSKLSATICWTDPAGVDRTGIVNSPIPALVNDLDIRLVDQSNNTYFPWKLDLINIAGNAIKGDNIVDTVEKIEITTPPAGTYTLTVSHKGTLTNGNQPFSLVLTGSDLTLGVDENSISNVKIWPNPVRDLLNINFKSIDNLTKVSLYDLHGREVYQQSIDSNQSIINHSIDTLQFSEGVYFLNIQNGSLVFNKKVVIKK